MIADNSLQHEITYALFKLFSASNMHWYFPCSSKDDDRVKMKEEAQKLRFMKARSANLPHVARNEFRVRSIFTGNLPDIYETTGLKPSSVTPP